jgi:hypothetical protein
MSGSVLGAHASRLLAAVGYPLATTRRALVTAGFAIVTYCLLVLSTFPEYSIQMLGADLGYVDDALLALTANTYRTVGGTGLGLTVMYAITTGVALTTTFGRVRDAGATGVRDLWSVLPGLLASGCASCGAGVLGLLGFAGALATMPFEGNLLRLGGIALLLGYLSRVGHPRRCELAPTADEA